MSTNLEIIDRALFELGYQSSEETASTADGAAALVELNNMMAEWRVSDLDLNWFKQDTLGDTIPIPDWAERGIISNLAVGLSAVFTVPVKAELAVKADNGKNLISRTLFNLNLTQADMTTMPQGRDQGRSILTDQ